MEMRQFLYHVRLYKGDLNVLMKNKVIGMYLLRSKVMEVLLQKNN